MKTLKLQSAGGLSHRQRRGRVFPAPLSPPPHPSATRSRWVRCRMRSDDAPREENDSKVQDRVVHSRLVDQTAPESDMEQPQGESDMEQPQSESDSPGSPTARDPSQLLGHRGVLRRSHPVPVPPGRWGRRVTSSPCTEPPVLGGSRGRGRGAGTWRGGRRS